MKARQKKKKYKVDTNLELPKWYHEFLGWNFEFQARYDAGVKFASIYSIQYSDT